MTVLTPEDRLAEQKFICDRRARIDAIRCLLATGEHLVLP